MKMIASTKLTRAQKAMVIARSYGDASTDLYQKAETGKTETPLKTIVITSSSDRGLCGGIHSSVSKATKRYIRDHNSEAKIIVLGDKAKAQLARDHRSNLVMSFNQIGKAVPTFAESSAITDTVLQQQGEFDCARIVYNEFKSMIAFEDKAVEVYSEQTFMDSPNFAVYELEDDVLANLKEFQFANALHWALVEGHAAEQAAKRTAMENATKNAGEMIDKLTLTYNRGRQASITNELVDIIVGASAL